MLTKIRRSPALLAVVGVIAVAALAFGWWTISPLFIKTTLVEGQNIPVVTKVAATPGDSTVEAAKPAITAIAMENTAVPGNAMSEAANPNDTMTEAAQPDARMTETAVPGESMVEEAKPDDTMKVEEATGPVVLGIGNFDRKDDFHYASGQAIIARQEDGSHVLRLQDLNAANGPDLYVYLTEHPNPANSDELHRGEHNLGTLKATNGSFSYALDPSVDVSRVKSVVIYCRAFSVIFSVATLEAEQ